MRVYVLMFLFIILYYLIEYALALKPQLWGSILVGFGAAILATIVDTILIN